MGGYAYIGIYEYVSHRLVANKDSAFIGINTRMERLDIAVAENERRICELTTEAQRYTASYDHKRLGDCLKAAEKLQRQTSRLQNLSLYKDP